MTTPDLGSHAHLERLYRTMFAAREMDAIEQSYTARGEAFFHVSGAGHESTIALAPYLTGDDWLHCHYRDKALMLERGISPYQFFLALFNKDESHSRGRQMNAHMSAPDLNLLSIVGPVGNSALHAAGVASTIKDREGAPIVLCALGEGMTQEGEVIEAIGHAVRDSLPVLFVVEDNAYAISTRTRGRTFYSHPDGDAAEFYGIPITRIDGRDVERALAAYAPLVADMRTERTPRIVVFSVERLHNHTNADDQRAYRTPAEIESATSTGDPLARLRTRLLDLGTDAQSLADEERSIREALVADARRAQRGAEPRPVHDAKRPLPAHLTAADREYTGSGDRLVVMNEAIREVLRARLRSDERIILFGEDIEDPKGDVFGVTRGLTDEFGNRVRNSPLSESLILGVSIGRALAGERPVAFLQFADFLPIAYNQIFSELGSMYWRTDGGWEAPVILMVTMGGYRPGLGPFHASSLEALVAHTPGIDVMVPSSAGDAAGMLNAAFESGRPTVFFYPKNQLNDRAGATSRDVERHLVPIGRARLVRRGEDLTIVAWGNTVPLAAQAAEALASEGVSTDVIDLRTLVPWDIDAVVASAERTGRLIVAHEDNHTAGFGAEVVATVAERARTMVRTSRVTRGDTYVPCNFGNQLEVLPSYQRILETAVDMLGGSVIWKRAASGAEGHFDVEAIGTSPSDESVTILEWKVAVGTVVEEGELLAEVEADKATAEVKSPVAGAVTELIIGVGDTVAVGTPIARIAVSGHEAAAPRQVTREDPGTPVMSGLNATGDSRTPGGAASAATGRLQPVAGSGTARIVGVTVRTGSRLVTNDEIASLAPDWSADDIAKRTGIERRHWVDSDETVLSLATDAVDALLKQTGVDAQRIRAVVFSTGTPSSTTPSMAALVHHHLTERYSEFECGIYDINAACAGYVYGLQIAHDSLAQEPEDFILLVTSEVLSNRLDMDDVGTAPIFGDAATATLISATSLDDGRPSLRVHRPVISGRGESGASLSVPRDGGEPITMDGPKVYLEAVRAMMESLERAATQEGVRANSLDRFVPHQANQRIINAIRQRMKVRPERMYSNIADYGNTSSSTIPICLSELLADPGIGAMRGERWGITAFGGGFTWGAGLLTVE